MNNKIYKFAKKLYQKGHYRFANNILTVIAVDYDKLSDREKAIWEQHMQDMDELKDPEKASVTKPPVEIPKGPAERRYEVEVRYPSFKEDGSPYFDKDSVTEYLTMTEEELLDHQKQAEQGYLQIINAKPLFPKSTRSLH